MVRAVRGKQPAPVTRAPRPSPRGWLVAAVAVVTIAIGANWMANRARRTPATSADPIAALDVTQAHERGMELARGGDPLGAVPYFRRVVALRPDSWNAHENLAGAVGNGALQARTHLGKVEIATRTSIERVAMLREAIRETEAAESRVQTPTDRATVLFERGRALQTWGFPIDALVFFRLAYASAPDRPEIAAALRGAQEAFVTAGRSGP